MDRIIYALGLAALAAMIVGLLAPEKGGRQ